MSFCGSCLKTQKVQRLPRSQTEFNGLERKRPACKRRISGVTHVRLDINVFRLLRQEWALDLWQAGTLALQVGRPLPAIKNAVACSWLTIQGHPFERVRNKTTRLDPLKPSLLSFALLNYILVSGARRMCGKIVGR